MNRREAIGYIRQYLDTVQEAIDDFEERLPEKMSRADVAAVPTFWWCLTGWMGQTRKALDTLSAHSIEALRPGIEYAITCAHIEVGLSPENEYCKGWSRCAMYLEDLMRKKLEESSDDN